MSIPKDLYRILKYGKKNITDVEITVINSGPIIEKNKAIFIHIPKAAGISLSKSLFGQESLGHFQLRDYISKYGREKANSLFTFTFVRNPYDRIFSAFNYLKKGGRKMGSDLKNQFSLKKYSDFESFVLNFYKDNDFIEIEHFIPQYIWLENEENEIDIDFVGKFENIEADYARLTNLHFFPNKSELVHLNKTTFIAEQVFTDKMILIINEIYEKDFLYFDYKKY